MRMTGVVVLGLLLCVPWIGGPIPPPSGSPPARGGGLHVVGGGGYTTFGSGKMGDSTLRFQPPAVSAAAAPRVAAALPTPVLRASSPAVRGGTLKFPPLTYRDENVNTAVPGGNVADGAIRYAQPAAGGVEVNSAEAFPPPGRPEPPLPSEKPILTLPIPNETVWIRNQAYYRVGNDYYRPVFSGSWIKYVRVDPYAPPKPREPLPKPITIN